MKIFARRLVALAAPTLLTACATIGPPQPPSLELPKPPSDLRAVRKGDRVILTWTIPSVTTDRQRVRALGPTRICRDDAAQLKQCGTPVGEAIVHPNSSAPKSSKQKPTASYTDSLVGQTRRNEPSEFITYAVEALNAEGRSAGLSNQVRVPLAQTLPPPLDFAARVTSQGVVLSWIGDARSPDGPNSPHYVYRVRRSLDGSPQQTLVGELPAGHGHDFSLTDPGIEWEKTYEYRAETVTVVAQESKPDTQIEGDDSPEVRVFAHDIFPPAVPSGLQAVFSGPGQQPFIDLIWAPVTDVDLGGYNVYRHEEGMAAVKLNSLLLKTPAYRDAAVVSGKKYSYTVSAVDVRGNESARSEEANEAVP